MRAFRFVAYDDDVNTDVTGLPTTSIARINLFASNAEETMRFGAALALLLEPGDVVALWGGFGAGKTIFVQGVGEGLRVVGPVVSPSFGLVHEYTGYEHPVTLYHLDLYRIRSIEEAEGLGIEEILGGDGVVLIEWPQVVESILPEERMDVYLEQTPKDGRTIHIEARGRRPTILLNAYLERLGQD